LCAIQGAPEYQQNTPFKDWRDLNSYWRVWQSASIRGGLMLGIPGLGTARRMPDERLQHMRNSHHNGTKSNLDRRAHKEVDSWLKTIGMLK
jgi:hypothetical protein